jgi:hypothetical protein
MTSTRRRTIDQNERLNNRTFHPCSNINHLHLSRPRASNFTNISNIIIFASTRMITILKSISLHHFQNAFDWYQQQDPQNFIHGVLLVHVPVINKNFFFWEMAAFFKAGRWSTHFIFRVKYQKYQINWFGIS